jgi:carbon monoxide dehydrogenase subunit G
MELTNEFRVEASPATTWAVLTDLERIAPCLPGAQLLEVEGEQYRGAVKVKVGPVIAQYKGTATFLSLDEAAHTAVLKADGREARGQGNASATVTLTLTPDGSGTRATVLTDLHITGKVAQFGRGVIVDVSANLIGKFVESLETTVLSGAEPGEPPAAAGGDAAPAASAPPAGPAAAGAGTPVTDLPAAGAAAAGAVAAAQAAPPASAAAGPVPSAGPTAVAVADEAGPPAPEPSGAEPAAPAVRIINAPEPEPVNLLGAAGAPVLKRVLPAVVVVAAVAVVLVLLLR